jgi:hypothetical protein
MTGSANAYTHIHPASEKDRQTVQNIIQIIRSSGKQDSGADVVELPPADAALAAKWLGGPNRHPDALRTGRSRTGSTESESARFRQRD